MDSNFDFNFGLYSRITPTGRVQLFTDLYVVTGVCDGVRSVLRYYLNRDDAERCVRVYSEIDGYSDVSFSKEILFV